MSSDDVEFEYNYKWSAGVEQTATITVLGEQRGPLLADETIHVDVPLSLFKQMVVYQGAWDPSLPPGAAGEQPYPAICFRPTHFAAARSILQSTLTALTGDHTEVYANRIFQDAKGNDHNKFTRVMVDEVSFVDSILDSNDLPREAIRSIEDSSVMVEELASTVSDVTTIADPDHELPLKSLFEQLVGAGRIKADDIAPVSPTGGFENGKCPSFQVGDSLSFVVEYTFIKMRNYAVDSDVTPDGNASSQKTLKITYNGVEIELPVNNTESSGAYPKKYEFKMTATAD